MLVLAEQATNEVREGEPSGTTRLQKFYLLCACTCFFSSCAIAQDSGHAIREGFMSSFQLPLNTLLEKKHASEWRNLLVGLQVNAMVDAPLQDRRFDPAAGFTPQGPIQTSIPTARIGIQYSPLSYWFFKADGYLYADAAKRAPWNPSFTYVYGYNDWHPYTLSLTYSNYNGNRFAPSPSKGEGFAHPTEGQISGGYKFPVPRRIERLATVTDGGRINCEANYNLAPEYFDLRAARTFAWKQSVSLNLRYEIVKRFYAEIRPYIYLQHDKQQPWDPDYTYTFGWFDYRPAHFSLIYSNYSGNRYDGHHAPTTGTFRDGSISLIWTYLWD